MQLKCWGVRGSIASPGPDTAKYGGNTSCYEVLNDAGQRVIMDCGTGVRKLGLELMKSLPVTVPILISHTHWDHIQGFPFFVPNFIPGNKIDVYAPKLFEKTLEGIMKAQMDYTVFPVRTDELSADINYHNVIEGPLDVIPGFEVIVQFMSHPITAAGYKVIADGKSIVYTGDHEKFFDQYHKGIDEKDIDPAMKEQMQAIVDAQNQRVVEYCKDVDLLLIDAMYTDSEYPMKVGWGHSTIEMDIDLAIDANVKNLVLTHHEPIRTDEQLDKIFEWARKMLDDKGGKKTNLYIAQEGLSIKL